MIASTNNITTKANNTNTIYKLAKIWLVLVFFAKSYCVQAQLSPIPTGTWRNHYDFAKGQAMAAVGNKIYYAAQNGLLLYDLASKQITILEQNSTGIHENAASQIGYNSQTNQLLIAYKSGGIDICKLDAQGNITSATYLRAIKDSQAIFTEKHYNEIFFDEKTAYLAATFGLVAINLTSNELQYVARNLGPNGTEIPINSIAIQANSMYLLSPNYLLGIQLTTNTNLQNYQNWQHHSLPQTTTSKNKILAHNQQMYILQNKTLTSYQNGEFGTTKDLGFEAKNMSLIGEKWYISASDGLYTADVALANFQKNNSPLLANIRQLQQHNSQLYITDTQNGLLLLDNNQVQKINLASSPILLQSRDDEQVTDTYANLWQKLPSGQGIKVTSGSGKVKIFPTVPLNDLETSRVSNTVLSVVADHHGLLYVGTDLGIVAINPDAQVTAAPNLNSYIITPRSPDGSRTLQNEIINSIEIDGGNRKWIGTANGLYLYNADFTKLISKYSNQNDPLPSNQILNLNLDHKTGELFVFTNAGVVGYRTDATKAEPYQGSNVEVFPNPVRPNFDGVLTINGLVYNALVKITDPTGRIVHQTQANGGTATWNLLAPNGQPAAGGIYYILSTNEQGSESLVSKVAIVR
jgi:hypothetical protein